MPGRAKSFQQFTTRLTVLVLGLLNLTACGGVIAIVPAQTPTPPPATSSPVDSRADASSPSGLPTRIVSMMINLDAPVVEMGWRVVEEDGQLSSEWNMPENEAAWHKNSARPGKGSNVIISGHNASTGSQVFAQLDDLQLGDEVTLKTDRDESHIYQVVEKNIIRTFAMSAQNEEYLRNVTQATTQEQLTLITCWPSWSNTHRLIVIAHPKPPRD